MKMLTPLAILVIVFTSCGVRTLQETRQERERLIAVYDAARQKHNPERVKEAVKALLIGKWQYMGLEVEEGGVIVQKATPVQMKMQMQNTPKTHAEGHSKGTTSEQATAPSSPNPEGNERTSAENAPRLPPIEVTDEKSNQQILGAKAALVASTRQNLILEFSEKRSSYYYSGSNRGRNATGQCYVTTKRYGDAPFPFISFNRRTGPDLVAFLFGSDALKRIVAKKKREYAARQREIGILSARWQRTESLAMAKAVGITVDEERLYLSLYGDMGLTPKGWRRTGGLRCIFKRIE